MLWKRTKVLNAKTKTLTQAPLVLLSLHLFSILTWSAIKTTTIRHICSVSLFAVLCLSLPATPFSRKTIAQKIEPATTTTWRRLTTRPTPPQPPRWSLFSRRKHCCTMSLPRDPRRLRPPPPPPPKMPLCPHDPRLPKDTSSPTPTTVVPAAVPAAVPAKESRLPPKLHLR